jgi:ethanolamine utilization protein EutP (predicted NTPase)
MNDNFADTASPQLPPGTIAQIDALAHGLPDSLAKARAAGLLTEAQMAEAAEVEKIAADWLRETGPRTKTLLGGLA